MIRAAAVALVLAAPAGAQTFGVTEDDGSPVPDLSGVEVIDGRIVVEELNAGTGETLGILRAEEAPRVVAMDMPGAVLRGLDKVSGEVMNLELGVGEAAQVGRLTVALEDCRVPEDNPTGEAYALVRIEDPVLEGPAFHGWMIASSPALSALEHSRYDVWVIRCSST